MQGQIQRTETGQLSRPNTPEAAIEKVILKGDLRSLTEIERVQYNFALCRTLKLNPLTHPIDYIEEQGKLKPYINAIGVAQLRDLYGISCQVIRVQTDDEFIYATARATNRQGRYEEETAIIFLFDKYGKPLVGQAKANAIMKSHTKAKRRATLALCGIPWGDSERVMRSTAYDPPPDVLPEDDIDF